MLIYITKKNISKCVESLDNHTLFKQRDRIEKTIYYILCKINMCEIHKNYKHEYEKVTQSKTFQMWWNNGRPFIFALIRFWKTSNFELFCRKFDYRNLRRLTILINDRSKFHEGSPHITRRIINTYIMILLSKNKDFYIKSFSGTYYRNKKIIDKCIKKKSAKQLVRFL